MNLVFRTDASTRIGSGHVMRCLTLAQRLQERGHHCTFISREHPGNLNAKIQSTGFPVQALPIGETSSWLGCGWKEDANQVGPILQHLAADWLVVDHYALDQSWQQAVLQPSQRLLVIDDLANRTHLANLLLDQNLGRKPDDYRQLTPADCTHLTGPHYALLRPEFHQWRPLALEYRQKPRLKQLLITFGGVDAGNATGQVLEKLKKTGLPSQTRILVLLGPQAPAYDQVRQQLAELPWDVHLLSNVGNMAELMSHSDLCIGAAGGTSWERACLGLPTLVTAIADNQQAAAEEVVKQGISWSFNLNDDSLIQHIDHLLASPGELAALSSRSSAICDGRGCDRVVEQLQ